VEELRQKLFSKYDGKGQIWGKKGIRAYYDNAMVFRWKSQSPLADGQKS